MNSQILNQSRQTPTRGVTVRSPGRSGIRSPTYRGDYAQTRNLPSTNPIRAPTPDMMPRHERISSTAVPNGQSFAVFSLINKLNISHRISIRILTV